MNGGWTVRQDRPAGILQRTPWEAGAMPAELPTCFLSGWALLVCGLRIAGFVWILNTCSSSPAQCYPCPEWPVSAGAKSIRCKELFTQGYLPASGSHLLLFKLPEHALRVWTQNSWKPSTYLNIDQAQCLREGKATAASGITCPHLQSCWEF